jgi:superfamily I DNA/RNA helicase
MIRQLPADDKGNKTWGHDKCPPVPNMQTDGDTPPAGTPIVNKVVSENIRDKWATFQPSVYQADLRQAFIETEHHLVVQAVAGSGKTTSLCWLLATAKPGRCIFLAFNKSIAAELRVKLPPHIEASTLNASGHRMVSHVLQRKLDPEEGLAPVYRSLWRVDDTDAGRRNKDLEGTVIWMSALCRGALMEPSQINLALLAQRHDVEGYYLDPGEVLQRVTALLNEHVRQAREGQKQSKLICDFDSQIWLPYALNLAPIITYDTVLVDEAQDLNAAQHDLVLRLAGKNGRVVAVGDENQAVYGFRGANVTSMQDLTSALRAHGTRGVVTKPLSICYRCPEKVVKLVQATGYCPVIQAADNAPEGEVFARDESELVNLVREAAGPCEEWGRVAVLSPLNAPLFPGVLRLIREGIPATVQGRDDARKLRDVIKRVARKCADERIETFLRHLGEARQVAMSKAMARNEPVEPVCDVYDALAALSDGPDVSTINDLSIFIDKVFVKVDVKSSDKVNAVVFSTIHRFKGMERPHILILRPDALPFPWARQDWEQQQARNLAYVAFTRAQERLVFLTIKSAGLHGNTAAALAKVNKPTEPPPGGGGFNPPEGMLPPISELGNLPPLDYSEAERLNDISRQACADYDHDADSGREREPAQAGDTREDSFASPKGEPVEDETEDATSEESGAFQADAPTQAEPTTTGPLPQHPTKGDGVYTPPTLEDWRRLAAEYTAAGCEAELVKPDGWRQMAMIVQRGARMVRVSTTLNMGASEARGKGANAIDICLVESVNGRPIAGRTKVLRTAGWKGRVCERINSLLVRGLVTS